MNKPRLIIASSLSATLTVIFVTIITIVAELTPSFKEFLKNLSGHHWTSKSILSLVFYIAAMILLYFVFRNIDARKVSTHIALATWTTVLGILALLLFYTAHNFGWL